ncbi:MAG TPA: PAS domain S-box protein, partial [Syntrophales bacterium]|nr:PAS domain S-box protein [Syntrophales bacterium]
MIPKTILVIDNNPVILTLTERLLARLGHEVITASSGIGALQILKQSIPDIILLDLVMPDISGDRLCRLIRENSRFRATRIVIVTAMASEERIPFLEMGADACIAKAPFNRLSESIMGAIEHLDRSAEPIPEVIGLEHVQSRIIVRELNSIRNSLETVISSISEGVFELDPSGVIRNVNRAAVSISEKEERELPGLNFVELFNDSDTKKILGLFQEAGEAPTQPAEFEIPSGRKLSLQVFRFAGEDEKLLVLATDVTGFESELEESRKRYLEITELLPQMVFETDQSGCITYINLNAASFLGIDNSQSLSGQNLFEYIDAGDQERSRRDFQRIIAGERISGVEYTAVNRKGKRIPLLVYSAPILENDLPVGVRAVAADITERKKYEDDLRISEEKYRGILESIDDGYFELDLRGNLVFANPALPRMWGYRFEDLYGRNYRNYMDEESARNIWLKFNDVFKTGRPERILDGKFFRKDGSISYFQTSVGLILDSGKEPIGFRGIIRDVSERKLAEEALRCAEANYRNIFENAVEGIFQT